MAPYRTKKCKRADIDWIAATATELYGRRDAVPLSTKLSWFGKNPKGFWVLQDHNGTRVGSLELLPIKESTLLKIMNRTLAEKDKTPDDIVSKDYTGTVNIIYIENIMSVNTDNEPCVWGFKEILSHLEDCLLAFNTASHSTRLYAMPIPSFKSKHGKRVSHSERLLRAVGFNVVVRKTKQGYPLYAATLGDVTKRLRPITERFRKTIRKRIAQPSPSPHGLPAAGSPTGEA